MIKTDSIYESFRQFCIYLGNEPPPEKSHESFLKRLGENAIVSADPTSLLCYNLYIGFLSGYIVAASKIGCEVENSPYSQYLLDLLKVPKHPL